MEYTYEYEGETYVFVLTNKRVRNINARMKDDGIIHVSAPLGVSAASVRRLLLAHGDTFRKARIRLTERLAARPDFTDGSQVPYLGRSLTLCYDTVPAVLCGDVLHLPADSPAQAEVLWRHWLQERCYLLFDSLNRETCECCRRHGYDVPLARITIREMTSRWGSCTPSKARISMNLRLMQYPVNSIRSVFFHEYAHFMEQNHSDRFYAVLEGICPDYRKWDALLRTHRG